MWRYLKAALLVRPVVPGLGAFPVNVLALVCFAILGFAHPGFWFLGVGVEAAFLALLASNRRFQRLVDGTDRAAAQVRDDSEQRRQTTKLSPGAREHLARLDARIEQAASFYREIDGEDVAVQSNLEALGELRNVYLRLLLAQTYLTSPEIRANETALRQQVQSLRGELEHAKLPPSLQESKAATLNILERRLENLAHRERSLAEIDADLSRIEAQVDLAVENAALRGKPAAISANVGLVSQLLDDSLYGAPAIASALPES
jgi:hypothetical protein